MKASLISCVMFFASAACYGQTISGYVTERSSGEHLIGATIFSLQKKQGTTTNSYGYYSLNVKSDSVSLTISYVGFETRVINLRITKDTVLNVGLENSRALDEVIIKGERVTPVENTRMSTISLPIHQIKGLPALMGEIDVMKVMQLLPGVQSGSEGTTGLYVRGGGQDQNLILLDGVPVYNASHLYGFFSTFNPDAVNHVELVKGGFPARYGGRLSSVIDINMKEGNQSKFHTQASIGLIASRIFIEGPIKRDRTSFTFSARRTYLNLLNGPIIKRQTNNISDGYFFYDLNGKINHKINDNNRIYFSVYNGLDKASSETEDNITSETQSTTTKRNSSLQWGNTIAALRWNHLFSKRLFSNFTGTYSRYQFDVSNDVRTLTTFQGSQAIEEYYYKYNYSSGIRDLAFKSDFDFIINPKHYLKFGAQVIGHKFEPGVLALSSTLESSVSNSTDTDISGTEANVYVEDDFEITSRLRVNVGIHAATFLVQSHNYNSVQPRLSARYLVMPALSLKASYSKMQQFIHLLTNSGLGLPTDLWVPATTTVKPQIAEQSAVGLLKSFNDIFEVSVEGYYKKMSHLIEYKDGANYLDVNNDWQTKIESGRGRSYGAEFFVQKKTGRINGWIGYTISKTERQFDNINKGNWFPYRYDRRHDFKTTMVYSPSEKIEASATWVYGTGNAVTVPLDWYQGGTSNNTDAQLFGNPVIYYGSRNGYRMRSYHRMDFSFTYILKSAALEHRINFSVYNVYNRNNPYYLEFGVANNQRALKQVSLFPILPSISYTVKI